MSFQSPKAKLVISAAHPKQFLTRIIRKLHLSVNQMWVNPVLLIV